MPDLVTVILPNLCSFRWAYLTSSGTAHRVDQKGPCCPGVSAGPGSAARCVQGSQHSLTGCVQSSTPAHSVQACARLHTVCWCMSLCTGFPQIKHWCLQINVKWYNAIFCFFILLDVCTGMPVTVNVSLYLPGPSWLVAALWFVMGRGKRKWNMVWDWLFLWD